MDDPEYHLYHPDIVQGIEVVLKAQNGRHLPRYLDPSVGSNQGHNRSLYLEVEEEFYFGIHIKIRHRVVPLVEALIFELKLDGRNLGYENIVEPHQYQNADLTFVCDSAPFSEEHMDYTGLFKFASLIADRLRHHTNEHDRKTPQSGFHHLTVYAGRKLMRPNSPGMGMIVPATKLGNEPVSEKAPKGFSSLKHGVSMERAGPAVRIQLGEFGHANDGQPIASFLFRYRSHGQIASYFGDSRYATLAGDLLRAGVIDEFDGLSEEVH